MNRQRFLFLGGVILILILAFLLVSINNRYKMPESEVSSMIVNKNNVCNSSDEKNRQICLMGVEQSLLDNYLRSNISDLSPEKEVLGGKFYITNISWLPERTAIVDYEDGHIALIAKVVLDVKYQDGWPEMVEVKSFQIITK